MNDEEWEELAGDLDDWLDERDENGFSINGLGIMQWFQENGYQITEASNV